MKTEFMQKVSRSFHRVGFTIKKHSPEILVGVGVVGSVATVVMACKATLKVNDIIDEAKETIDKIHEGVAEHKETKDGEEYTQEMANKDLAITYIQTGWKFVKLYGPAVAVGVASMGCMIGSNQILRKRNAVALAAYTAVETSFKEYRGRVIDRFGEKLDRELRYNIQAKEVEERVVDENGNETVEKRIVEVIDPNMAHDIYTVCFCEGCNGWTKNPLLNKKFLLDQLRYANDKLKREGFVSLNEVFDMLGIPRSDIGQLAGWVYTEDSSIGDNFISFGIFDDPNDERKAAFVNGYERNIWLNLNCRGDAWKYANKSHAFRW